MALNRIEAGKPFEPIIRERVMERLSAACAHRIALVVAPAGFGKSVAVRHFLERAGIEHIRYALRGEHASLLGFARGLAEALQPVVPGATRSVAEAYEKATKSSTPAMDMAVWACSHIKQFRGTIVIDDFHEAVDPDVSKFVAEIVERTEDTTRWLIVTRETLQLPVASWFAYGRIDAPIDEGDLKITLDEATEIIEAGGVGVRREELAELLELTEGWPVAFTFALRSSMRSDDFKKVTANTRMLVYDYLAEQVFHKLREDERDFLLDTCVFPTIDVGQLTRNGWSQAGGMIQELRRRTAFISIEGENVYRYHELFRQYLLRDLEHAGNDALSKRVLAAAQVYEKEKHFVQAISFYIQIKSEENIEKILHANGFDLLEIGRGDLVHQALDALSESKRNKDPLLLTLRAVLESSYGNYDRTDACYEEALRLVVDKGLLSNIVQRRTHDLNQRLEYDKLIRFIESYGWDIFVDPKVKARMLAVSASAYGFLLNKEKAEELIKKALQIAAMLEDDILSGLVFHQAAYIAYFSGEYEKSESFEQKVIEIAKRDDLDNLLARAYSVLSSIAHEQGNISQRLYCLQQMKMHAERAGHAGMALHAISEIYEIHVEAGNEAALAELSEKISGYDANAFIRSSAVLLSSFALQASWNADFPTSLRILRDTHERQGGLGQRAFRWSEIAVYAVAAGERELAEEAIRNASADIQQIEEQKGAVNYLIQRARVFLVLAQLLMGKVSSARNALQHFERGRTKMDILAKGLFGVVRALHVHVETGASETEVAEALMALRQAGFGGYARLFDNLPLPEHVGSSPFGALTKTELAILRALALGNSSKGIGLEMERSALTVDTHVKSIVRKLGCKGRREAVSLAREHGIL